ncbi:hypothetical protein EYF80_000947 [Liparis tanakae]|uniref:Uncharacterized protein n=1 Tax=Liparis tanakae TaxID=230148 RepID=A0A4Z2JEB8_9TELE|nr:hypothetical protein EYF80_000947 [Liparis tanakae]
MRLKDTSNIREAAEHLGDSRAPLRVLRDVDVDSTAGPVHHDVTAGGVRTAVLKDLDPNPTDTESRDRQVTLAQKNGANFPPQRVPWHSSHSWSSSTHQSLRILEATQEERELTANVRYAMMYCATVKLDKASADSSDVALLIREGDPPGSLGVLQLGVCVDAGVANATVQAVHDHGQLHCGGGETHTEPQREHPDRTGEVIVDLPHGDSSLCPLSRYHVHYEHKIIKRLRSIHHKVAVVQVPRADLDLSPPKPTGFQHASFTEASIKACTELSSWNSRKA